MLQEEEEEEEEKEAKSILIDCILTLEVEIFYLYTLKKQNKTIEETNYV